MIYICIAAHNEEQTVGVVLWKIRQVMAEFPRDYQLLVVDDASSDKTPDVLAPYARVLPLTVVRTERRRGQAAAVEMMLREAVRRSEYPKRDVIVTLQADFTQEPDELVALIKRMEAGADIVVGQAPPDPRAGWAARWARRLALRLLARRLPEGISDPFLGYAAYRVLTMRKALEEANGRLVHWGGWAGAAALLAAASPHARRVEAVDMIERRERLQRPSRMQPWAALRAVWDQVRGALPREEEAPEALDQAMLAVAARRTSEVALAASGRGRNQRGEVRTQRAEGRTRRERPAREERTQRGGRRRGTSDERASAEESGERRRRSRNGRPAASGESEVAPSTEPPQEGSAAPEQARRKRPRRRKRPARAAEEGNGSAAPLGNEAEPISEAVETVSGTEPAPEPGEGGAEDGAPARRRRRGRRGGRRRRSGSAAGDAESTAETPDGAADPAPAAAEEYDEAKHDA